MASQQNLEVVRRSIEAFGRGDLEGVLDTLAPDFEFEPSGRFMDVQRVYRGREGFREFWNDFRPAWEDIEIRVERTEDLGDRVLTLGKLAGRGGGSHIGVDAEQAWLHTVRGGQVVRLRSFTTWAEAREVAGVSD